MPKPNPRSVEEKFKRRAEAVERLTGVVARFENKGDFVSAVLFSELLLEAQSRLAETASEIANKAIRVGDHDPEPRTPK